MLVLVSYDVETGSQEGRKRLRRIARVCLKYGLRVQNSVFECHVDAAQKLHLTKQLLGIANLERDSIRLYQLGNKYQSRVEHFGAKPVEDLNEDVILV